MSSGLLPQDYKFHPSPTPLYLLVVERECINFSFMCNIRIQHEVYVAERKCTFSLKVVLRMFRMYSFFYYDFAVSKLKKVSSDATIILWNHCKALHKTITVTFNFSFNNTKKARGVLTPDDKTLRAMR